MQKAMLHFSIIYATVGGTYKRVCRHESAIYQGETIEVYGDNEFLGIHITEINIYIYINKIYA